MCGHGWFSSSKLLRVLANDIRAWEVAIQSGFGKLGALIFLLLIALELLRRELDEDLRKFRDYTP